MSRLRFLPDNFTLALLMVVTLASLLPARGEVAHSFERLTAFFIGLLFFMHGARLSREAIVTGIMHWRLHLLVFACTFVLFPLLGIALQPLLSSFMTPEMYLGILFLCVLPATVQSAIAFTSVARGNIPAAVCSASASTLIGIFLTPPLAGLLIAQQSGSVDVSLDAIARIMLQLLAPFTVGQLMRPWISRWIKKNAKWLKFVDQGSILLVVYTAFSAAVVEGLWQQTPLPSLAVLVGSCAILLALALCISTWLSRRLGFSKEDEITIVFCGSKKSLASGIPIAKVLFASHAVGTIVLPIMIFHQMQLMVCAVLAQRYARRTDDQQQSLPPAS